MVCKLWEGWSWISELVLGQEREVRCGSVHGGGLVLHVKIHGVLLSNLLGVHTLSLEGLPLGDVVDLNFLALLDVELAVLLLHQQLLTLLGRQAFALKCATDVLLAMGL